MRHLIIGNGPAGVTAAETVRQQDSQAEITLLGDEPGPPYARMAIPYFLAGSIDNNGMMQRRDPAHYSERNILLKTGQVTRVEPDTRSVYLKDDASISYDRLLIATGCAPVIPDIEGVDHPDVVSCWTVADARRILARINTPCRVLLIGAGFIASTILEALVHRKLDITVVEAQDQMIPGMMEKEPATLVKEWCQNQGIRILTSTKIAAIEHQTSALVAHLERGDETITADLVILATGVAPTSGFLESSGIALEQGGVVVDEHLSTNRPGIYAAGNVARGRDLISGAPGIQAIQTTAVDQGRIAGLNMAAGLNTVGRKVTCRGNIAMNALNAVGLTCYSFGHWMGVPEGDSCYLVNRGNVRYLQLQFLEDRLVGASMIGDMAHPGMVRGLIQSRTRLGKWKARLKANPGRLAEAYLATLHKSRM